MAGDPDRRLPPSELVGAYRYIVIDQLDLVTSAVNEIRSQSTPKTTTTTTTAIDPKLAVDLEGVNLGRHGTITLITVSTRDIVFLFDLLKLGPEAFDLGLKVRETVPR